MMRKQLSAVICLALVLATLAGCAATSPEDVLAKVNDEPVYRWQFDQKMHEQMVMFETMLGIDLRDQKYQKNLQDTQNAMLDELCLDLVSLQKAREQGLDLLSEAEIQGIEKQYQTDRAASIETVALEQFRQDADRMQKAEKSYDESLNKRGLTPERVVQLMKEKLILNRLLQPLTDELRPTEAQLQAEYASQLQRQKETYEAAPAEFGTDAPALLFYVPEGYIRVKRVRLSYAAADMSKLNTLYLELSNLSQELGNAFGRGDEARQQTIVAELGRLQTLAEEAQTAGLASVTGETDAVIRRITEAGIDQAIKEFSTEASVSFAGHYVCKDSANYPPAFLEAALALKTVGEVSPPVATDEGIYILRLEEIMTAGPQPIDGLRESIAQMLIGQTLIQRTKDQKAQWLAAAKVEKYADRI